jgi:AraC-like DNA-binding protein
MRLGVLPSGAGEVGFSDRSQLCFHFKRIVDITPGQFRASAKIT